MLTNFNLWNRFRFKYSILRCFYERRIAEKRTNGNYIINLQSSNEGWTHWTAWIIREKNSFYFDSFGAPPCVEIIRYCKKNGTHLYFNNWIIQDLKSSLCGFYCLSLLLFVFENKQREKSLNETYNEFINLFQDNTERNGKILKEY